MRSEPCACGATLRWPIDDHAWPRLMRAHVRSERHQLWRMGRYTAHVYEEHLTPLLRRVA